MSESLSPDRLSPDRPTQAVILAGGRGTRLRPLTDLRPKPMVEFHGKPFLEYVLEMLRGQGFERVLLLLGYLPEVIQRHFGTGERLGLKIEYVVSAPDDGTVRRMRLAAPAVDPCFLLLYCDNYWPLAMDRMWARYAAAGMPAMITVYRNTDGYTKDSVRVDGHGVVTVFDRSRTAPDLGGVEISYAILRKSVLRFLTDDPTALFEETVYPRLVAERQLAAFETDHRYYSVGGLHRLPLTEVFLARRPAIILDRDGVLNRRPPRAQYVRTPAEFEWLPGAREALRRLTEAGHRILVVTNQAGVARGALAAADLQAIHCRMSEEARDAGGWIDAVYHCPHDWDAGCACRKPKPGLLYQAQRDFNLDLTRTLFVGDDERDAQAAEAADCRFMLVAEGHTLLDITRAEVAHA